MRFGLEALLVFVGAVAVAAAAPPQALSAGPVRSPPARPSPSPTPRYKLVPYAFESAQERSTAPQLRFEDKAEVRALEMNAAIARYFDPLDEKGNMHRGAAPGGAPSLNEMRTYRPHVSPAANFTALAFWAIRELKEGVDGVRKTRAERNQELLRTLLLASPEPTPTPSSGPTPTPTPR